MHFLAVGLGCKLRDTYLSRAARYVSFFISSLQVTGWQGSPKLLAYPRKTHYAMPRHLVSYVVVLLPCIFALLVTEQWKTEVLLSPPVQEELKAGDPVKLLSLSFLHISFMFHRLLGNTSVSRSDAHIPPDNIFS